MKLKNSSTFCPIPWNHIGIQHNGDLRQCCQMIHDPFGKFKKDGEALRFSEDNIELARNHESVKKIRKDMIEGKRTEACKLCWDEEDAGIFSKRKGMIWKYDMNQIIPFTNDDGSIDTNSIPLTYLDLRLGNLCNLKCRSCGPADSSLWVNDHAEMSKNNGKAKLSYYGTKNYDIVKMSNGWRIDTNDFDWHEDPSFHSWLDKRILEGVDRLYFTGGEPTVNKQHMKILDRIIELGKADRITLEYNSNLVAIPPRLIEQWKKFGGIGIGASIDAIGPLAHYVRHPSNWNDIEKNCDILGYGEIPNIDMSIATTISVYNIRHFIDMTKWLLTKNYTHFKRWPSWHMLHGPVNLNVQILPPEIKKQIEAEYEDFYAWTDKNTSKEDAKFVREYYSGIIRFMNQEHLQKHLYSFKIASNRLDKVRDEKLEDHIPWLADILDNL